MNHQHQPQRPSLVSPSTILCLKSVYITTDRFTLTSGVSGTQDPDITLADYRLNILIRPFAPWSQYIRNLAPCDASHLRLFRHFMMASITTMHKQQVPAQRATRIQIPPVLPSETETDPAQPPGLGFQAVCPILQCLVWEPPKPQEEEFRSKVITTGQNIEQACEQSSCTNISISWSSFSEPVGEPPSRPIPERLPTPDLPAIDECTFWPCLIPLKSSNDVHCRSKVQEK